MPDPRSLSLLPDPPLPVTVLTGFLGSGKTTLVRGLLAGASTKGTAVVVNEFGEVGLDHLMLEAADDSVLVMPGGCLCCQAQGDLARALRTLLDRSVRGEIPAFSRVIVETSGLADPRPLLQALLTDPLRLSRFRLEGIATTFDAVLGPDQLERHEIAMVQLQAADKVVLTKRDLAGPDAETEIARQLRRAGIAAPLVPGGEDDEDLLFSFDPRVQLNPSKPGIHSHDHAGGFASHGIRTGARQLDLDVLMAGIRVLCHDRGQALLRLKGVVRFDDTDEAAVIHAVQHLVDRPRFMTCPGTNGAGDADAFGIVAIFSAKADAAFREALDDLVKRAILPAGMRKRGAA
ncbi:CobW family GTP-binding protein [Cucumibacter marinus]|uniref:CobW family GTP-binding protein n=1 Tax=Cucumibacter marinus TaxID=1121252 RepID=UPI00138AB2C6|nr:GTP-binding protein [Cucumibacter marinus]